MIDYILNLIRNTSVNKKLLCSHECIHKKFKTTESKIIDRPDRSLINADSGRHYCTKYNKHLTRPYGGTDLTHPIQNCGGMIEEINELQ